MRELTGNLVACRGGEPAVARMAANISQQFRCERFQRKRLLRPQLPCKEDQASRDGRPLGVFYAGAIASLGMLD